MYNYDEIRDDLESEIKILLAQSQKKYCDFDCDNCLHNDEWIENPGVVKTDEITFEEFFDFNSIDFSNCVSDWISRYKICELLDTKIGYNQTVDCVPQQKDHLTITVSYIECRRKNVLFK